MQQNAVYRTDNFLSADRPEKRREYLKLCELERDYSRVWRQPDATNSEPSDGDDGNASVTPDVPGHDASAQCTVRSTTRRQ